MGSEHPSWRIGIARRGDAPRTLCNPPTLPSDDRGPWIRRSHRMLISPNSRCCRLDKQMLLLSRVAERYTSPRPGVNGSSTGQSSQGRVSVHPSPDPGHAASYAVQNHGCFGGRRALSSSASSGRPPARVTGGHAGTLRHPGQTCGLAGRLNLAEVRMDHSTAAGDSVGGTARKPTSSA